jgi:hypothetical protein
VILFLEQNVTYVNIGSSSCVVGMAVIHVDKHVKQFYLGVVQNYDSRFDCVRYVPCES